MSIFGIKKFSSTAIDDRGLKFGFLEREEREECDGAGDREVSRLGVNLR